MIYTFNNTEIEKIKEDKIFKKKIKDKSLWIKPIKETNYMQGNIENHEKYIRVLKKYINDNIPKIESERITIEREKYLIISVENIKGKILSERIFARLLLSSDNLKFRNGIAKLLKKGYVLDFYGKRNFIQDKNKKIYYIDTRMPLFTKNSNEGNRFNISKNKTIKFCKKSQVN